PTSNAPAPSSRRKRSEQETWRRGEESKVQHRDAETPRRKVEELRARTRAEEFETPFLCAALAARRLPISSAFSVSLCLCGFLPFFSTSPRLLFPTLPSHARAC